MNVSLNVSGKRNLEIQWKIPVRGQFCFLLCEGMI